MTAFGVIITDRTFRVGNSDDDTKTFIFDLINPGTSNNIILEFIIPNRPQPSKTSVQFGIVKWNKVLL